MFANRITDPFPGLSLNFRVEVSDVAAAPSILPVVPLASIYQVAAQRAYDDHQLDRLFNAEYYGDHGSGI